MNTAMPTADILDQLDALDRELAAVRAAPAPLEYQLAQARADFDAAAAAFKAEPWSQRAGIRGALAALLPKETARFELDRVRQRAAADPREPLDDAIRRSRSSALADEIDGLLVELTADDLTALERLRDSAHAHLRGLNERRAALASAHDRRSNAIALLREEREAGPPVAPPEPPPDAWPGYDARGEPRLTDRPPRPRPLSKANRQAAATAIDQQLVGEAAALQRDRAALAAIEEECAQASARWRAAASVAERGKRWLQRKPVAVRMPAAAE